MQNKEFKNVGMHYKDIWQDKNLKSNEKLVLIYLIDYYNLKYGYCFKTREQIQKETGIAKNTLNKILNALEDKEYIIRKRNPLKSGKNNIYYINKYLVVMKESNMTMSEFSTEDLTSKLTNDSTEAIKYLADENVEALELTTNEQLLKDNAKLNHALNKEQKEQVSQLDTDRLIKAIKQANKFAIGKYTFNYLITIYKNNNVIEKPHRDKKDNLVKGVYQQKMNTKPLTKYHDTFNEHYKNYSEDELEAKLLKMQSKRKI